MINDYRTIRVISLVNHKFGNISYTFKVDISPKRLKYVSYKYGFSSKFYTL